MDLLGFGKLVYLTAIDMVNLRHDTFSSTKLRPEKSSLGNNTGIAFALIVTFGRRRALHYMIKNRQAARRGRCVLSQEPSYTRSCDG